MTERKLLARVRIGVALLGMSVMIPSLPVWAQGQTPTAAPLANSSTPALVSLALLVIGLLAVGLVAMRVIGMPVPGTRPTTPSIPDDDELIRDDQA